jgi:hypothetical protein
MIKSLIRGVVIVKNAAAAAAAAASARVVTPTTLVVPVTLGRWSIQYDENIIDRKINQANEDHCGCCVAPKNESTVAANNKSVALYEKTEEYLLPYVI